MQIEISAVTGTYNRLAHLQKMVRSIRASIPFPIPYEIILVDGGSTDGTIEWAKQQPDVVLIEQGELLGAIRAFNAGFAKARGRYVAVLNDDVELIGYTILRAYAHMEEHPNLGGVAFYQVRGQRRDWHVEVFGCHDENYQKVINAYVQCGLVPRWLGDHVGWWGNITRTYGGDCELTANILGNGYAVRPVQGCGVMDQMVEDELRKINNPQGTPSPEQSGLIESNPDTVKWWKKWLPHGPLIRGVPTVQPPPDFGNRRRILYTPIFEPGYAQIQQKTRRGLREALMRIGAVVEYDYYSRAHQVGKEQMMNELASIASALDPHLFVAQVQSVELVTAQDIQALRKWMPNAVFVNWNGDIRPPEIMFKWGRIELAQTFDLATFVSKDVTRAMRGAGVNAGYWQIGVEPDGVGIKPDNGTPRHDVVFLGNAPPKMFQEAAIRTEMCRRLVESSLGFGLYGMGWPDDWASGANLYDFTGGAKLYRAAKLNLGISERADEDGYFSNRLLQAMAAGGSPHLCQRFKGMEALGLHDGDNLILWDGVPDLMEKIKFWLQPEREGERKAIAARGERWAIENHSFDVRVLELLDALEIGGFLA